MLVLNLCEIWHIGYILHHIFVQVWGLPHAPAICCDKKFDATCAATWWLGPHRPLVPERGALRLAWRPPCSVATTRYNYTHCGSPCAPVAELRANRQACKLPDHAAFPPTFEVDGSSGSVTIT